MRPRRGNLVWAAACTDCGWTYPGPGSVAVKTDVEARAVDHRRRCPGAPLAETIKDWPA